MQRVSAEELCSLYQSWYREGKALNKALLFGVGWQLATLASKVPTFDQDDHDWGKDAGKFFWAWDMYLDGRMPSYMSYSSPEDFIFCEIDTLLAGCHTDNSVADYYVQGGTRLLDAIFSWNGNGSLFAYYRSGQAPVCAR